MQILNTMSSTKPSFPEILKLTVHLTRQDQTQKQNKQALDDLKRFDLNNKIDSKSHHEGADSTASDVLCFETPTINKEPVLKSISANDRQAAR